MNIRQIVIDYLVGAGRRLEDQFGLAMSGLFLHGSLVNNGGSGFATESSDVDVLVTTPLSRTRERVDFVRKLHSEMQRVEEQLRSLLSVRTFYPVASVCVATQFELDEGIHHSRNSRMAFSADAYFPLLSKDISLVRVGEQLKEDLMRLYFPAWTILAEAQYHRSHYAGSFPLPEHPHEEVFDGHLPLPKDLLRTAYLFSCLEDRGDPAMVSEDDIANGLTRIVRLLDDASKVDSEALELLRFLQTHRITRRVPLPVRADQLLYLWELLCTETETTLKRLRLDSDKKNFMYAADIVTQDLARFNTTDLTVVDTAVALYKGVDLLRGSRMPLNILRHFEMELYQFSTFVEENLMRLTLEWPPDIQQYLISRLHEQGSSDSQCKIGFAGITYSQTAIDQPTRLTVRPLTYWVTQQFNKEMAVHPDHVDLKRLREKYSHKLFACTEDFYCECPSSLYLEMATITADGMIPRLSKTTKHSVLGKRRGEPVLTCGIEWGFSWDNHVERDAKGTWLNIEKALFEGLSKELFIEQPEVDRWSVTCLAIQHAHLNAALLGVVRLKLTSGELMDRLRGPEKYFHSPSPSDFERIDQALVTVDKWRGTGKWHQTALMRLTLATEDDKTHHERAAGGGTGPLA
jgi:hypothetical protein